MSIGLAGFLAFGGDIAGVLALIVLRAALGCFAGLGLIALGFKGQVDFSVLGEWHKLQLPPPT
jgi:hypothetical protein